jgi:RNA polymerase primary sigma factor
MATSSKGVRVVVGPVAPIRPPQGSGDRSLVMAARRGEAAARARLVAAFRPLVCHMARTYAGTPNLERDDLLQAGVVGLLRAADRYDPELGTRFWAYASWWVRQAMQQTAAELGHPVVLSDRALRQLARVKAARQALQHEAAREPSSAEVARRSGIDRDHVERLLACDRRPRGLAERVGGAESGTTVGDLVADPRAEDGYDALLDARSVDILPALLDGLTERERQVVCARFGLDGPARTLRELGSSLGLTGERVRQIERGALDKLRAAVVT